MECLLLWERWLLSAGVKLTFKSQTDINVEGWGGGGGVI